MRGSVALFVAWCLLAGTAHADAAPIESLGAATAVREYRGTLVFSAYERDSNLWFLTVRPPGGPAQRLPVAGSDRPFDADIGPDTNGRPELVYQRCTGDRLLGRCDLYAFSLARPTGERAIANANSFQSDVHPTLWRGRLAWTRIYGSGAGAHPVIYTKTMTAPRSRPSRRLPGVAARRCTGGACTATRARTVRALELYGRRLASVTSYTCSRCTGIATTELRLDDLRAGGPAKLVARQTSGLSGQTFVGPSFFGGDVAWYLSCAGDPGACEGDGGGPFRARIATGDTRKAVGNLPVRVAGFVDNGAAHVAVVGCAIEVTGDPDEGCRIEAGPAPGYRKP